MWNFSLRSTLPDPELRKVRKTSTLNPETPVNSSQSASVQVAHRGRPESVRGPLLLVIRHCLVEYIDTVAAPCSLGVDLRTLAVISTP